MKRKKMAKRIARRVMLGYEPESDLEKVIGEFVTQEHGVNEAPKKFFDEVEKRVKKEVEDESDMDGIDLDNNAIYPIVYRHINDVVDEMDLSG